MNSQISQTCAHKQTVRWKAGNAVVNVDRKGAKNANKGGIAIHLLHLCHLVGLLAASAALSVAAKGGAFRPSENDESLSRTQ